MKRFMRKKHLIEFVIIGLILAVPTLILAGQSYLNPTEMQIDGTGIVVKDKKVAIGTANATAVFDVNVPTLFDSSAGFPVVYTSRVNEDVTTIDWSKGNIQEIVVENNLTLTFNDPAETANLILLVDFQGTFTLTLPADIIWHYGATPNFTSTAGAVDIVGLYYVNGNYYGVANYDFE